MGPEAGSLLVGEKAIRTLFQTTKLLSQARRVSQKPAILEVHQLYYLVYSSYLSTYQGLYLTPSPSLPSLRGHPNCWQGFGSRAPANFFQANQSSDVEGAGISSSGEG